MDNLDNENMNEHQETIHEEDSNEQPHSPLIDRASSSLGDLLIRVGTRLKERTHARLTTEEGSPPSFIIML